jgi:hypothetical protein
MCQPTVQFDDRYLQVSVSHQHPKIISLLFVTEYRSNIYSTAQPSPLRLKTRKVSSLLVSTHLGEGWAELRVKDITLHFFHFSSCKPGVHLEKCTECQDEYKNFSSEGCSQCGCDVEGSLSPVCAKETGQCPCKVRNATWLMIYLPWRPPLVSYQKGGFDAGE